MTYQRHRLAIPCLPPLPFFLPLTSDASASVFSCDLSAGKGRPVMSWSLRMKCAIGAAKGLAYLHEDCKPPAHCPTSIKKQPSSHPLVSLFLRLPSFCEKRGWVLHYVLSLSLWNALLLVLLRQAIHASSIAISSRPTFSWTTNTRLRYLLTPFCHYSLTSLQHRGQPTVQ